MAKNHKNPAKMQWKSEDNGRQNRPNHIKRWKMHLKHEMTAFQSSRMLVAESGLMSQVSICIDITASIDFLRNFSELISISSSKSPQVCAVFFA